MKNAYIHDEHIGKVEKRQRFYHNDKPHWLNTNLITNEQWFSTFVNGKLTKLEWSIDLELSFELRKSYRLV